LIDSGLPPPDWLTGGSDRDVVVSCRVSLQRNLGGALFPGRASLSELGEVRARLVAAIEGRLHPVRRFLFEELDPADSAALRERSWCGRADAFDPSRAVILDADGVAYSVNETDHLQLHAFVAGSAFLPAFELLKAKDQALDAELDWACTEELGFLTARLDQVGSALAVSALVFLPGTIATGMFERVSRGLENGGVQVRFNGQTPAEAVAEPTPAAESGIAPYVEVSARAPLGVTEDSFLDAFRLTLASLVSGERRTRERYLQAHRDELEDAAYRAAALLTAARSLPETEARQLCAALRAGLVYGVAPRQITNPEGGLPADPYAPLDQFLLCLGPGHARMHARSRGLAKNDPVLDKLRAELARGVFPRYDIGGGTVCSKD